MTVSFSFSRGALIVRRVRLRHGPARAWARMALDTGARVTVVAPTIAGLLGFELDRAERSTAIVGATGADATPVFTVASVSVMDAEVTDLPVVCYPLHPKLGLDGVLGLDFLEHFDVEIRNSDETVTLTRWRE